MHSHIFDKLTMDSRAISKIRIFEKCKNIKKNSFLGKKFHSRYLKIIL